MPDQNMSPGWYPDPDGAPGDRWWNGAGWSDSRRGAGGALSVPPPPPPAQASQPQIYSAANPAPQRPDPYGQVPVVNLAVPGRSIAMSVNRNAMIGFITGLIALFFNVFFILGPVAIVFSLLGLARARQLSAEGVTSNLRVFAIIGVVSGAIATLIGFVGLIAFLVPFLQLSTN